MSHMTLKHGKAAWLLVPAGALALALWVADAAADTRLDTANKHWHTADECNRQSFKQYPDYTADGAAKRDAFVRECLRNNHLPPVNDAAQPQTPQQR